MAAGQEERALECGHWSLSAEHVAIVRISIQAHQGADSVKQDQLERKQTQVLTESAGAVFSVYILYINRMFPLEAPSYQFCKLLLLFLKVLFFHCESLSSIEIHRIVQI